MSKRILHDGNAYHERESLKAAIKLRCSKLVCDRVPIIRMLLQVWEEYFDLEMLRYLIVDERGLIPEMFLFGLIANLPNIQQVLIMGDQRQLPSYMGALTENVICLGHKGAIHNLMENGLIKWICLTSNFRSHPVLVGALSAASYDRQLVPALGKKDRMMWRLLEFPVKVANVPILMLHTTGQEYLTVERSWFNGLHNGVAVKARRFTLERIPEASIKVLCYYSASVKRIAALEPDCQVFSINQYQGRECDFSIIVTT